MRAERLEASAWACAVNCRQPASRCSRCLDRPQNLHADGAVVVAKSGDFVVDREVQRTAVPLGHVDHARLASQKQRPVIASGGAATELTDQRANRAFLEEAARADDHRREIAVGVAPDARCVRPGRVIGGDDFQRRRRVDVVEYERPQTPRFCPAR